MNFAKKLSVGLLISALCIPSLSQASQIISEGVEARLDQSLFGQSTFLQTSDSTILVNWLTIEPCDQANIIYWNVESSATKYTAFSVDQSGVNYSATIQSGLKIGQTYNYYFDCFLNEERVKSATGTFNLTPFSEAEVAIEDVSIDELTSTSVIMYWSTDRACDGTIVFWRANNINNKMTSEMTTQSEVFHSIRLKDLDREANYNYQVHCKLSANPLPAIYPSELSSLSFKTMSEVDDFRRAVDGFKNDDVDFGKDHGGKIFLQVESKGEAWYINPETFERHYLGRPANALQVMREVGLGISNADLRKIPQSPNNSADPDFQIDTDLVDRVKGRILLQVESKGEAWYVNPATGYRHSLGRPAEALEVMRMHGIGITNTDIIKMPIAS